MASKLINHTGRRFGKLVVLHLAEKEPGKRQQWLCQCDCGRTSKVRPQLLTRGETKSCGCLGAEHNRKRGPRGTPEWQSWRAMKTRCLNPNATGYERYGGCGIKIWGPWLKFETFLADMGPRPSPEHSLDRFPNPYGDYEPDNCRWATPAEQRKNHRKRGYLDHQNLSI